jgi:hypothetical protein
MLLDDLMYDKEGKYSDLFIIIAKASFPVMLYCEGIQESKSAKINKV